MSRSLAVCVWLNAGGAGLGSGISQPEDELRAAVVLSIVRYAEWPQPDAAGKPITVGIVGRKSLGDSLRRMLDGKVVNGRPLRTQEINPETRDSYCCQIIYLATDRIAELKQELSWARSIRAVTIGEADPFLEFGGVVNLRLVDSRVTFEVNLDALESTGVVISSKLLRFGHIVQRRTGERP